MGKRIAVAVALYVVLMSMVLPSSASTVSVTVGGFQYVPSGRVIANPFTTTPAPVVVPAGNPLSAPTVSRPGSLIFTNRDALPHTVTKASGPVTGTWTSISLPGAGTTGTLSISTTFPAGAYEYTCTVHPGMRGAFTVV